LRNNGIKIWVWHLKETMLFVPEHDLVPEHIMCTRKEKKKLYKQYGTTNEKMPHISTSDMMVRYLGAERKTLIKIIRPSATNKGDFNISYRVVM